MVITAAEFEAGKVFLPRVCPYLQLSPGVHELCERGQDTDPHECSTCRIMVLHYLDPDPLLGARVLQEALFHIDDIEDLLEVRIITKDKDFSLRHALRKVRTTPWHWIESMKAQWEER